MFINRDLTIHLSRLPMGEWAGLESHTSGESQGIAISGAGSGPSTGRRRVVLGRF